MVELGVFSLLQILVLFASFEFLNCVSFLQSNYFSLKKETYFPLVLTMVNSESESVDDYYFLLYINLVCFIFQK